MKHSRRLIFIVFILILFLTFGCGTTSHFRILEPVKIDTSKYVVLEITDIENYVPQTFNQEMCKKLKARLIAAFHEKVKRFKNISEVSEFSIDPSVDDVLVFKPTIVGYEPGSGAKRFWLGFGAGKAVLQMQLDIYVKGSGEKMGACVLTGEAMHAGTNVYRPMAQQFVAYINRFF